MVCSNCNSELDDSALVCDNCGTEINSKPSSFKSEEIEKADAFSKTFSGNFVPGKVEKFKQKNGSYRSNYTDYEKSKKPIVIFAIFLLLFTSLFLFLIFKDKIIYSPKGKRTIMIYMIGSDLESKYLAATKDINEIIDASINYDDINILIYTGGAKKWHIDGIPSDKHALFEVNSNGLEKIEEFDVQTNMLDYENLTYLLKYGYENYETEFYDLIFWDHGAGPIYGYGYDEYYKIDTMSLEEIKKGLDSSPFNSKNKLELIGFDACLMSSVEIASVMSNYSDYMVASQEFEPGNGWDYGFLSHINKKTSTVDFGKEIVDYFDNYYSSKEYIKGYSLSLLRLNKVDNLNSSISDLFTNLDSNLTVSFPTISRSRSVSKSFGRLSSEKYYYDLVDLVDFASKLPKEYEEYTNNLKSSVSDLVIYQKTDLVDVNGVSIYFPYENRQEIKSNLKIYESFIYSRPYYEFLSKFSNKLTGERISNWNLNDNKIESLKNGEVTITLSDDILKNYSSADYIIFEKTNDNYYIPIFNGNDVVLNGNKLSTKTSKKAIVALDDEGNKLFVTSFLSSKGKNYIKYNIAGTLSKWDSKKFDFEIIPVYLEFVVDNEHEDGYVSNVFPMDVNNNYTYSKFDINVNDWDILSLLNFKYNIIDSNGNYTSSWINSGIVQGIELDVNKDYIIKFADLDVSKDYYCLFRVRDSQGNVYLSKIVEINNK